MTTPTPATVASALTTDKTHLPAASLSRVTPKTRSKAADRGEAMPDGSYPIRDGADLKRAIAAFGRAKDKGAAKRHIIRRAKALGKVSTLPESWKTLALKEFPGQRGPAAVLQAADELALDEADVVPEATPAVNPDEVLAEKAARHNLVASADRQVSVAKLKVIYRRGVAEEVTHSCVTPDQRAHARVNAFLHALTASALPDGFTCRDDDLLPKSHPAAPASPPFTLRPYESRV